MHKEFGQPEAIESPRDAYQVASRLRLQMEWAETGDLEPPEEVAQIRDGDRVAELRVQIHETTPHPVLYRLYYSEPVEVDRLLLALKFSKKYIDHRKKRQDDDIDSAIRRLNSGKAHHWGLKKRSRVTDCFPLDYMKHVEEEEL